MESAVCPRAERFEPLRLKTCEMKIPNSHVLSVKQTNLFEDVVTIRLNFPTIARGCPWVFWLFSPLLPCYLAQQLYAISGVAEAVLAGRVGFRAPRADSTLLSSLASPRLGSWSLQRAWQMLSVPKEVMLGGGPPGNG